MDGVRILNRGSGRVRVRGRGRVWGRVRVRGGLVLGVGLGDRC